MHCYHHHYIIEIIDIISYNQWHRHHHRYHHHHHHPHYYLIGEDEASVEKAAKMIEDILSPDEDKINEHKQNQLRELALINGMFNMFEDGSI